VREALGIVTHTVVGDETASWAQSDAAHARLLATDDVKEGVRAFFERRSPQWTGH
jgi:enoyl-CoA hydratase/carnithine racemase